MAGKPSEECTLHVLSRSTPLCRKTSAKCHDRCRSSAQAATELEVWICSGSAARWMPQSSGARGRVAKTYAVGRQAVKDLMSSAPSSPSDLLADCAQTIGRRGGVRHSGPRQKRKTSRAGRGRARQRTEQGRDTTAQCHSPVHTHKVEPKPRTAHKALGRCRACRPQLLPAGSKGIESINQESGMQDVYPRQAPAAAARA